MRRFSDRLVGRVTMYRLLVAVLGAMVIATVAFGAVGVVHFSPLAQAVSLSVSLVVSYGSNRFFAWIWHVRPHGESSVITGLLLFFLFFPSLTPDGLSAVGLAAVGASLSKYVLAWRGRHVFNPVAAGAVVVMLTHVSGATWWVATPAMLPIIVVGGALVLYRANAWDISVPAATIAVVGTGVELILAGASPAAAGWTAVATFPYLFFAAFMVSEPLTAPPRRWQRLFVGSLVGVVALVPVQTSWFEMAPEIALVIGNLVAFWFGPKRRIRLTLVARGELPSGLLDLRFRPESPLGFEAGQYLELSLPRTRQDARGARRVFSIANAPGRDTIRILTRIPDDGEPMSTFKEDLAAMREGDVAAGSAVGGDFVLRNSDTGALWVAGGIGITPFLSFADAAPHPDTVLIWAVRETDPLDWVPELDAAGIDVLLVGPASLATRVGLPPRWRYTGTSIRDAIAANVPDLAQRSVYVAGAPRIVDAVRRAGRTGRGRIRTDRFLGY